MVRKIIIIDIEEGAHTTHSYILCDECFNNIAKNVDFSGVEEPPWRDESLYYDSRHSTEPERLYYIGIYIRTVAEDNKDFCSACGIHRGFRDTSTFLLRNKIRNELTRRIRSYRVYRKLMEFMPKKDIDKLVDSVYTTSPLSRETLAAWASWSDEHPYD